MGSVSTYFENVKNAAVTIFEGMAVTLSWMFRRPITIQYPDRTPEPVKDTLPDRFRGILEVHIPACTACSACARACPIDVILVETQKHPSGKGRLLMRFDIDISKCMYCGLCTEACPTGCLRHTPVFEATGRDIHNLVVHFVDGPVVPYKHKKGRPVPASPPPGDIVQALLKPWDAEYVAWSPGEFVERDAGGGDGEKGAASPGKVEGGATGSGSG